MCVKNNNPSFVKFLKRNKDQILHIGDKMKVRSYYKNIIFTFFISTQNFACEYIDDQYARRRGKYNDQLGEMSFVEHTKNTNKLLSDYNMVSNVSATLDQKKSIIKTTMTKFFVHVNPEQYKLSFKVLKENDKNYRHFKILEQTEALSDKLAKQLIDKDGRKMADSYVLAAHWNDYKELDEFGQITQEMFLLWFNEALADHNKGLSKPITSAFVEVEAAPTSPQRFTPNLSVIIDRKQKYGDIDSQHFSPISHEKVFTGKKLSSDSDAQSTSSSATTLPEHLSDLTSDHTDTPQNGRETMLSESELLKISNHTFVKAATDDEEDEVASTATDYNTDYDQLDDIEYISPTEDIPDNAGGNNEEWDDLTIDEEQDTEGKRQEPKDAQSYVALIAGILPKINFWS